jgi:hypothetical protein
VGRAAIPAGREIGGPYNNRSVNLCSPIQRIAGSPEIDTRRLFGTLKACPSETQAFGGGGGGRMNLAAIAAVATVVACTVLLAGVGAGIGWALGTCVPGYYRSVFPGGNDPRFDPVAVGVGQGLTQGAAGGVPVGLAVVAILAWRDVRLRQLSAHNSEQDTATDGRGM